MPSASGSPISVEQASDAEFQAWIDASGLHDLIDDAGIAEWSFDDRVRAINYALRKGIALQFIEQENNSNNSANNSDSELLDGSEVTQEGA